MAKYEKPKELDTYNNGTKEARKLEGEYDKKAATVHRAYEAAVAELGFGEKELANNNKARKVAKLMFSDKYLGNPEFNPEINKDYSKMSELEKQEELSNKLGMNLSNFTGPGGIINQYGGLRRGTLNQTVEKHYNAKVGQMINNWIWMKTFDPDANLEQNMKNYAALLRQDPLISGSGAKVDPMKFDSIDDIAGTTTAALRGYSSKRDYENTGVQFN